MEHQELLRFQRELGVRLSVVIAKLDFVCAIEKLDDGSDLAAHQAMLRDVRKESDDIKQLRFFSHDDYLTLRSSW